MKTDRSILYRTVPVLLKTIILPAIILILLGESALALKCGNRLVSIGDRKYVVLKLCGQPLFIEKWTDETVLFSVGRKESGDLNIAHTSTAQIEEWTYNFGSTSFIRFLRFVDGKLRKIEEGIKGFSGEMPIVSNRSRCGSLVSRGDRKIEILMKCGEPDLVEFFGEDRISTALQRLKREGIFQRHDLEVQIEEWTYDFGPGSFLLFIRLENGRVVRTESGDYGF
jgi:hypothetical protein